MSGPILVVEREESMRNLYNAMLPDYNVVTTGSMDAAIEQLQKDPSIKLVFTAVGLVGKENGYELCRYITEHHKEVRTVFSSGIVEPALAREAGAVDILVKPFKKLELEEMVKKHYNSA